VDMGSPQAVQFSTRVKRVLKRVKSSVTEQ